jgi:hypothetical protein
MGFLRHLPVWGVVCGMTYLTRLRVEAAAPLTQLLICIPVGLVAGAVFIWLFAPSRRVAISFLSLVRESKPSSA